MGHNVSNILSKMSTSKWLKALDLQGREVAVTVSEVELGKSRTPDGREVPQLILKFVGKEKYLGLNVTNTEFMAAQFGGDTDGWKGAEIILYTVPTQKGPGIRLRRITQVEYNAAVEAEPPIDTDEMNQQIDNIPF